VTRAKTSDGYERKRQQFPRQDGDNRKGKADEDDEDDEDFAYDQEWDSLSMNELEQLLQKCPPRMFEGV